ncbi:hypothetical protein [Heliophilum fasciatum]|uniref:Uncharacterized protein n=1 Tax=Heliophilum fasciatum TaxID=35700 RepID=A0A4R2RZH1_9FIRM|nr:hypothetical protein [Heliophilum fasciatum]MCW2276685.1 hypothetical protein [Heliophilum fasciatum]TCP68934.1 hypothetical protein EDD73_101100 [Heliophilum fasciatum]
MKPSKSVALRRRLLSQTPVMKDSFFEAFVRKDERWQRSLLTFRAAWQGKLGQLCVCRGQFTYNPLDPALLSWHEIPYRKWKSEELNEIPLQRNELGGALQAMLQYWALLDREETNMQRIGEELWPDLGRLYQGLAPLPPLGGGTSYRFMQKLRPEAMQPKDVALAYILSQQNLDMELTQALGEPKEAIRVPWWDILAKQLYEEPPSHEKPMAPWYLYAMVRNEIQRRTSSWESIDVDPKLWNPGDLAAQIDGIVQRMVQEALDAAWIIPWKSEHLLITSASTGVSLPNVADYQGKLHLAGKHELLNEVAIPQTTTLELTWLRSAIQATPSILGNLSLPWEKRLIELDLHRHGLLWRIQDRRSWPARPYLLSEQISQFQAPFYYRVFRLGTQRGTVTTKLNNTTALMGVAEAGGFVWQEAQTNWQSEIDAGHDHRCSFYLFNDVLVIVGKDETRIAGWEKKLSLRGMIMQNEQLPLWLYSSFRDWLSNVDVSSFPEWRQQVQTMLSVFDAKRVGLPDGWQQVPPVKAPALSDDVYLSALMHTWKEWFHQEPQEVAAVTRGFLDWIGMSREQFLRHGELIRGLLLDGIILALPQEMRPVCLRHQMDVLDRRLVKRLKKWTEVPFGFYQILSSTAEACRVRDFLTGEEIAADVLLMGPGKLQAQEIIMARLLPLDDGRWWLAGSMGLSTPCLSIVQEYLLHDYEKWSGQQGSAVEAMPKWYAYLQHKGWKLVGEVVRVLDDVECPQREALWYEAPRLTEDFPAQPIANETGQSQ